LKISFSNSVITDLDEIKSYYLEQGIAEVGDDINASAFSHIETLLDHPDIGRVVPEFEQQHIREFIHSPYRIIYLRGDSHIQIIRIWRSERLLSINQVNELRAKFI
jgi:plasmid stabilization system protein ParE